MASVNKVILVGNLGRDPEVRYSPDGAAICNVSIATTSQWKDKASGERREETEWHRVVMYNRLAEIAGEYLKKGRSVYIEGRLKTRKWQDKDTGADRYSTEIVADQMQMLGGREGGEGGGGSYGGGGGFDEARASSAPRRPRARRRSSVPLRRPPRPAAAPTWRTWTTIFRSERHTVAFSKPGKSMTCRVFIALTSGGDCLCISLWARRWVACGNAVYSLWTSLARVARIPLPKRNPRVRLMSPDPA